MNSDFSIGWDGFATGGSLSDMGSFDTGSATQDYNPGGHVIVGGGHFQGNTSSYAGHSWNDNTSRVAVGSQTVYSNTPFDAEMENRLEMAYNRTKDQMATEVLTLQNSITGRQITRIGSDSESSAWEKFMENTHGQNIVEAFKEWSLAFGSQGAGDVQGAMEHALNAAIATGKVVLHDLTFQNPFSDNGRNENIGTMPIQPDRDK